MNKLEFNNQPIDVTSIDPVLIDANGEEEADAQVEFTAEVDPYISYLEGELDKLEESNLISKRITQLCALVIAGLSFVSAYQCQELKITKEYLELTQKNFEKALQLGNQTTHDVRKSNVSDCLFEPSDARANACVRKVLDKAITKNHRIQHRR